MTFNYISSIVTTATRTSSRIQTISRFQFQYHSNKQQRFFYYSTCTNLYYNSGNSTTIGTNIIRNNKVTTSTSTSTSTSTGKTIRVLVVGSGIIGLRTAWELLSYNTKNNYNNNNTIEVVVVSSTTPFDEKSCSVGSGGLWMPFRVADEADHDSIESESKDDNNNVVDCTTEIETTGITTRNNHHNVSTVRQDITTTTNHHINKVDKWAISTLDEYYPFGIDPTNDLVEIVPTVRLLTQKQQEELQVVVQSKNTDTVVAPVPGDSQYKELVLPTWTNDKRLQFQQLPIEMLCWQNTILQLRIPDQSTLLNANYTNAWLFYPPIINTYKMLQYLHTNIANHSNTIEIDYTKIPYNTINDIISDAQTKYNCSIIVNCTGLGSQQLCNDTTMIGIRGILHIYNRINCPRIDTVQQCPIYGQTNTKDTVITADSGLFVPTINDVCYMIPKGDTILIGGTVNECNSSSHDNNDYTINDHDYNQLRTNAYNLGIDTDQIVPTNDWVGYRPYRTTSIRCEIDNDYSTTTDNTTSGSSNSSSNTSTTNNKSNITLYHNYGFGGSGWTLNVGSAKHITQLITTKFFGENKQTNKQTNQN